MTSPLIEGLRNWADGFSADRAAVELLITHESWLVRPDFLDRCVTEMPVEELFDPARPIAIIDWDETFRAVVDGLPASSSMVAILRIAVSLGRGEPVDLRDALVGLDATNTAAVATAVVTAAQADTRVHVTLAPRDLPGWLRQG
ncbi:hypothetical protein DFP74_5754 [Nocardiopsis sp. Huas11]|uniref:hypothetical protein n=1 Tax=Nocardiopsis sp. Huas11 TaxID=2183912 RepID=UPI000EABBB1A|nr:hypothetical protein [Nocardiopsis sp. Huas11]RKS10008.1 hypothetical protein DFP74_5754 [Nocardiopsis sp. Huas11]